MNKSDNEWKKELSPEVYEITRNKGTEPPFSGKLLHNKDAGIYACSNCGSTLFSSDTKFDSGSGWPSFYEPANREAIELVPDSSLSMKRTEVLCKNCGAHLGHVFDDAPDQPSGKRFCVNSLSLDFEEKK